MKVRCSHLSLSERRKIERWRQTKLSPDEMARRLGRHGSTIHREVRRNFWHDPEVPMATGYWHMNAQHMAAARRSRQRKLTRHDGLPILEMEPSRSLPPLEWGLGVSPSQAGRSRADRKLDTLGNVAARTLAVMGPMPGIVWSRRAVSSTSASALI